MPREWPVDAKNYLAKADAVQERAEMRRNKKIEAGKQTQEPIPYHAGTKRTTQKSVHTPANKLEERPNDPWKNTAKCHLVRMKVPKSPYPSA